MSTIRIIGGVIMYGIIKDRSLYKGKLELTVEGSDGRLYYYTCTKHDIISKIIDLKKYERVEFKGQGRKILFLKAARINRDTGKVICTISNESGLIELSNGEVVKYSNCCLVPNQKVKATASNVSPDEPLHANCCDIVSECIEKISDDIYDFVVSAIRNRFRSGSIQSFDIILGCLKENGITMERFGFTDDLCFLESFPLALRICEDCKSAMIVGEEDVSPLYDCAYELLKKQGYEKMTVLQQRVFSDHDFWMNNRTLILGSTSSGKTAVALTKYLLDLERSEKSQKLLIAVNLRTLTTQFQRVVKRCLQKNHHLSVAISTSEYVEDDDDIIQGNFDVAIVIYEKLFIFASTDNRIFSRYTHFLVDEAAIVSDYERGAKVDIMLLKAFNNHELKICILGTPYYDWNRYIESYALYNVTIHSRPIPIYEYFVYPENLSNNSKVYRCVNADKHPIPVFKPEKWDNTLFNICKNEFVAGQKTIVFFFSQNQTRLYSQNFFKFLKTKLNWRDILPEILDKFIKDFIKTYNLSFEELKGYFDTKLEYEALYYGVAFHNASVPEKLRIAIETEFLGQPSVIKKGIRVIFSTDTLAYGINSNVDTVIMAQMKRFGLNRYDKVSFNTYQNCIGRSGRLGFREENCNYGKSYTFFQSDFESSFFGMHSHHGDVPSNAIRYYTCNSSESIEKISGRLGMIISEADTDLLALYLLSLFNDNNKLTVDMIVNQFYSLPKPYETDIAKVRKTVLEALNLLKENNMIRLISSDELQPFNDNEIMGYVLTGYGKCFQGYAIRMDSFKKLGDMLEMFIRGEEIYIFDYFLALNGLREYFDAIQNLMMTYERAEEIVAKRNSSGSVSVKKNKAELQVDASYVLIETMLPVFFKNKWITQESYSEIIQFVDSVKSHERLSKAEFQRLLLYRAAVIIAMWVSGYNVDLISELQGLEEENIDNIRRKFGEKVSYYTDIVCRIAEQRRYSSNILKKNQTVVCLLVLWYKV